MYTGVQVESWQEQYPAPQSIVPCLQSSVQATPEQLSGVLACLQLDAWQQDARLQSASTVQLCARDCWANSRPCNMRTATNTVIALNIVNNICLLYTSDAADE